MPKRAPSVKDPNEFYSKDHPKRRELLKEARRLRKVTKDTAERLAESGYRVTEDKGFEKKLKGMTDGEAAKPRHCTFRLPEITHLWLVNKAAEMNLAMHDVIIQLIKCADQGVVFHMERGFSRRQREFFAEEIRKRKRLEKMTSERAKARERLQNDRDALEHSLDPSQLKI